MNTVYLIGVVKAGNNHKKGISINLNAYGFYQGTGIVFTAMNY